MHFNEFERQKPSKDITSTWNDFRKSSGQMLYRHLTNDCVNVQKTGLSECL